jgi:hypothetical protein
MIKHWSIALLAASWAAAAAAADTGYLLKAADLKSKPFLDADTLVRLPEKTALEIVAREGPWMLVKADGKQGYVRLLQVRLAVSDSMLAAAPAAARPGPSAARPAGTAPIVTTGVRGFDEQGLKDAEPDPAAFALMVSFAASKGQAQQFAQASPLAARAMPYYGVNGKPVKEGAK